MKFEPLQQFICDSCGEIIKSVDEGWLEWLKSANGEKYAFRIVHHRLYSPDKDSHNACYYLEEQKASHMHLNYYAGPDGLVELLTFMERPLIDKNELVEIIYRLHIPHYEEARMYWDKALNDNFFAGASPSLPYKQDNLLELIETYGD